MTSLSPYQMFDYLLIPYCPRLCVSPGGTRRLGLPFCTPHTSTDQTCRGPQVVGTVGCPVQSESWYLLTTGVDGLECRVGKWNRVLWDSDWDRLLFLHRSTVDLVLFLDHCFSRRLSLRDFPL